MRIEKIYAQLRLHPLKASSVFKSEIHTLTKSNILF